MMADVMRMRLKILSYLMEPVPRDALFDIVPSQIGLFDVITSAITITQPTTQV